MVGVETDGRTDAARGGAARKRCGRGTLIGALLACVLGLQGCAVVAVTGAVVTVAATAVSATAKVAGAGIDLIIPDDDDDDDDEDDD